MLFSGAALNKTMKRDWLQITTNAAVVLGLILLIYELNQSRDLTRAQVVDSVYDAVVARNLALIGENPHEAIAKSVFRPEELTESDAVVLSQFYTALLVSWMRNKDDRGVGYFGQSREDFENVIASEAYFLNTEPGRRWWAVTRSIVDPEIVAAVDGALSGMSPEVHRSLIQTILGRDGANQ